MITIRGTIKAIERGLLAALFVLGVSVTSHAGPLGVTTVVPYPDIQTGFITTTYNATTGAFAANGWALTLDDGSGTKKNITTNFTVQATIDNNGQLVSGTGQLLIGNAASPLLKSVPLLAFGFDPIKGGVMEFLFAPPTGSYTADPTAYYSSALPIDVMLSVGSGFNGNFAASWSSSGGTGDVRGALEATPEPSALLLTLVGIGGLGWYGRRRMTALSPC